MDKEIREFICIGCPLGCTLKVEMRGDAAQVTGNSCKKGKEYGISEAINPVRTVTTTVRVKGEKYRVISVKTEAPIPKGKVFACMERLKEVRVEPPVEIGDVVCENVAGTGIRVVATKRLEK